MLIRTTTYTSTPGLPEPEGPADGVGHDGGGAEPLELITVTCLHVHVATARLAARPSAIDVC